MSNRTSSRPVSDVGEDASVRWRRWARYALFAAAGLALIYLAWAYLWPLLHPRLLPVNLPDEVSIEEVAADFRDDATAASKKYGSRRIVVVGKLVVEPVKDGKPGRVYYQMPGDKEDDAQVPVDFFDADDAGSVDSGDQVSLSGVMKQEGTGKLRLVGAGRMPSAE